MQFVTGTFMAVAKAFDFHSFDLERRRNSY